MNHFVVGRSCVFPLQPTTTTHSNVCIHYEQRAMLLLTDILFKWNVEDAYDYLPDFKTLNPLLINFLGPEHWHWRKQPSVCLLLFTVFRALSLKTASCCGQKQCWESSESESKLWSCSMVEEQWAEIDFETERSCRFCCQFSVSLSVTSLHRHIDLTLSYDTLILSSNIIKAAVFSAFWGRPLDSWYANRSF